jgi:hypothetical protein
VLGVECVHFKVELFGPRHLARQVAGGEGGAVWVSRPFQSGVTFTNATFYNNSARGGGGGGIRFRAPDSTSAGFRVRLETAQEGAFGWVCGA